MADTKKPAPAAPAVLKKVHKESGLEHEFPKLLWDALGAAGQADFEDAVDKPEKVEGK